MIRGGYFFLRLGKKRRHRNSECVTISHSYAIHNTLNASMVSIFNEVEGKKRPPKVIQYLFTIH
ncbi:MAG: hypothetical protein ACJATI_004424 [Halioglobus sp.]|jgi:hypothetical protein